MTAEPIEYNPRFVIWTRTLGRTPESFYRGEDDEIPKLDGMPWTLVFMLWIQAQWGAWERSQGRKPGEPLSPSDHKQFDKWLSETYPPNEASSRSAPHTEAPTARESST